ncbi:hypothetical protein [Streptomyces sp. DH12]|uniref:hypothetical protein n=1 Tax=Streptomyces sp. DH12 TaxID=2857010 RepID=UPI001E3D5505|nr:hypothetical protein [Streptomyces sp. DH12]
MNPLLKAGLAVTALGAALGAAAGTAQAADLHDVDAEAALQSVMAATPHATAPVKNLKVNPLAGTGVDPLNNGVGTQVSDFRPVETTSATGSVTNATSLPVAGPLLGGLIPG